ncbi:hypothetical protein [Escherichia coli]|uniref:hypothetical protein n=1 Tax=Escherichia coli TaxID=562 RepID=UPI0013ACAF9F|nr:hypothetical protein [Escherichia coli]HAL6771237.1 hypothetical protein [Escherichia coli]HBK2596526.1 hypothetical protein [Escherichia coli]
MTNSQLTDQKLTKIIESAEAVISALAGTNDDVHPDDSTQMCRLWDALNDNDAPPEVVLVMAKELQERRKVNSDLTMWVKRLGYSLKRAKPDSKLPGEAMAYLSAKELISVEDILR